MSKVLLVRLDKIGDLVSTMPVDQVLTDQGHEVTWVIAQGLGFLAENAQPKRKYLELSLSNKTESILKLKNWIEKEKPDVSIFFYGPWWVSQALWSLGVPTRVGRRSQWHSYLFLNKGLRQSRSQATKHEADYNQELVNFAFQLKPQQATPILKLEAPIKRHLFEKFDLRPLDYVVVHPGMAGSALNWPQTHYNTLIEKLIQSTSVVITGTQADEKWLTEIKAKWQSHPKVRILQNQLNFEELLFILKNAKALVAPSTGVIHLGASLGITVVGLYSPIQVQHPKRWGPRGEKVHILLPPQAQCPAQKQCLGSQCNDHPCLSTIRPDQVLECLK